MKITYYTHKPEECKTRWITVGHKLVGLRLLSFEIDSEEELRNLLSERGVEWAKRNLRFGFESRLMKPADILNKESNWGSDWVDDGV